MQSRHSPQTARDSLFFKKLKKRPRIEFCCCTQLLSCLTLCDPMDYSPPETSVHGDSPGKNTGVGCQALLQRIFPTPGSNPGLPHCRQILYCLNHQGSPMNSVVKQLKQQLTTSCLLPDPQLINPSYKQTCQSVQMATFLQGTKLQTVSLYSWLAWVKGVNQMMKTLTPN